MTDRHTSNPKTVRMPGGLLPWYKQHAIETGQTVNGAIVAALLDYRKRHENAAPEPLSIAVVAGDRQPPGTVSVVSPGEEKTEARSFVLAPEEAVPEPGECPPHPKARVIKGLCRACGTYVGEG